MTNSEPAEQPRLVCPRCGDRLSVELIWVGPPYLQSQQVDGFYCDNYRTCSAEWDAEGNPR